MSVTVLGGGDVQVSVSGGLGSPVVVSSSPATPIGVSAGQPQGEFSIGVASADSVQVGASVGVGPPVVVTGSGTTLVGVAGVNPFVAGENITLTTTGGSIGIAAANPRVYSVNFQTGTVLLSVADLTAAAAVHTHTTAQISMFSAAAASFSPVQSVAGRTGNVSIATSDVAGLDAAIAASGKVSSVQGMTGTVTLTVSDLSAAPAVHTHATTEIVYFTSAVAEFSPVSSVQGKTGSVTLTVIDLTAAAAQHSHSVSELPFLYYGEGDAGHILRVADNTNLGISWTHPFTAVASVVTAGAGIDVFPDPVSKKVIVSIDASREGVTNYTISNSATTELNADVKRYNVFSGLGAAESANVLLKTPYINGFEVHVKNNSASGSSVVIKAEAYASSPVTLTTLDAGQWAHCIYSSTSFLPAWVLLSKRTDA